jgi:hypothetical protein
VIIVVAELYNLLLFTLLLWPCPYKWLVHMAAIALNRIICCNIATASFIPSLVCCAYRLCSAQPLTHNT